MPDLPRPHAQHVTQGHPLPGSTYTGKSRDDSPNGFPTAEHRSPRGAPPAHGLWHHSTAARQWPPFYAHRQTQSPIRCGICPQPLGQGPGPSRGAHGARALRGKCQSLSKELLSKNMACRSVPITPPPPLQGGRPTCPRQGCNIQKQTCQHTTQHRLPTANNLQLINKLSVYELPASPGRAPQSRDAWS